MTPEEELEILRLKVKARKGDDTKGIFSRFMTGLGDLVYGGGQLLENTTEAISPGLADTVQGWDESLYGATGGVFGSPEGVTMDDRVNAREEIYRRETGIQEGEFDGARLAGQAVSGLASLPLRAASLPAMMAEGAAFNAAMPNEVNPGESYWGQEAGDAAVGAAGGAGGKVLSDVGGAWVDQYARPGLQRLREQGVEPTVGQSLGGAIGKIEEAGSSIPYLGSFFSAPRGRAVDEWQGAVLNDVVSTVDGSVGKTGVDGIAEAGQLIDDAYEAATDAMPQLDITPDFRSGMGDVLADISDMGMSDSAEKNFTRIFNDVVVSRIPESPVQPDMVGPTLTRNVDSITSDNLKIIESTLTKKINAKKVDPQLRQGLIQVRDFIRQQAAGQSDEYARIITGADAAYAKFKRVADAANVDVLDRFTPAQLARSSKKPKNATENQAAKGRGLMQRDAMQANEVLGNTLNDSGTSTRAFVTGLLGTGAGLGVNPIAGAVAPLLAAGSSRSGQKFGNRLIEHLIAPAMQKGGSTAGKTGGLLVNDWMED